VTVLDASSLINMVNSGVSEKLLSLPNHRFVIGPQALAECATQKEFIQRYLGRSLSVLPDDALLASAFFGLLEEYGLGLGETECLTFAVQYQANVCSDDRRAREMCICVLGKERVLGTARLLREAVAAKMLTPEDALGAYCTMKALGAFLPGIPTDYWSENS
jgi:predicted nucleic acid-binding protein